MNNKYKETKNKLESNLLAIFVTDINNKVCGYDKIKKLNLTSNDTNNISKIYNI